MVDKLFSDGKSLEDAFFRKRDAELIAQMRKEEQTAKRREALSRVSGIKDVCLLDQLIAHDVHVETLAAFSVIPIIEMAWADGEICCEERTAVHEAVRKNGISADSAAFKLVDEWLDRRPDQKLMTLWKNYVRTLCSELPEGAREKLKAFTVSHARTVAESAGGILGIGKVSSGEKAVLAEIESAF